MMKILFFSDYDEKKIKDQYSSKMNISENEFYMQTINKTYIIFKYIKDNYKQKSLEDMIKIIEFLKIIYVDDKSLINDNEAEIDIDKNMAFFAKKQMEDSAAEKVIHPQLTDMFVEVYKTFDFIKK